MNMKKYSCELGLAFHALILTILFLVSCTSSKNLMHNTPTPTAIIFDDGADEVFIRTYARGVDLNEGITIKRVPLGMVLEGPTPSPNYFTMDVLNHSSEPIRFQDQGFGLRTFIYDQESATWSETDVQKPFWDVVILPAKTESFDPTIDNSWTIPDEEFENVQSRDIRIFITGTGANTGKTYVAYYDLRLVP